jgi:hypothetical protein
MRRASRASWVAPIGDVQHGVTLAHDRHVFVPPLDGGLVHTHVADPIELASTGPRRTARCITPSIWSQERRNRRATAEMWASFSQSMNNDSMNAVKPELGSAYGISICSTPCSEHWMRGTSASRIVLK